MNLKKIVTTAAITGALTMSASVASAMPTAQTNFNTHYNVNTSSCAICHTTADGYKNKARNSFGDAFKNAGGGKPNYMPTSWTSLDATYGATIAAGNAPAGNGTLAAPTSTATTTTSSSSSGGGGCVASSATTPLMMVLAMLSLGFFVRRKKD